MRRTDMTIRLHAFLPHSRANGPGVRAVIWLQGCTLACPGCFNAHTHDPHGGELWQVDDLYQRIAALSGIEGITMSGGEPLQQRRPLVRLLQCVRRLTGLSIVLWTGFTWEEVQRMPDAGRLRQCVDVLICGRYDQTRRIARALRGSDNKTIHFLSGRYTQADLEAVPESEVIISPTGQITISGVNPLRKAGV